MPKNQNKGRGWHGASRKHAEAGRKGGLARARNMRSKSQSQMDTGDSYYDQE